MEGLLEQIAKLLGITLFRYFTIAGIFFLIFYTFLPKKFSSSKIQLRKAGNADFLHEIKHSVVTSFIFALIGLVVLFSPLTRHTLVYSVINKYPLWWVPVSLILSLVIHDTYFYWMHRLLHHKSLFKHAHLVHHKSTNPSPWASYSFHVLESLIEGGVLILLAFILPMHPIAIILFILIGFIINVYGHLGYEIMPKGLRKSFLFEIINTSVHHNLHHSKFKGNYGLYFRIWDRLCKTENPDYVKEYDRMQAKRFDKTIQQEVSSYESLERA
jgi:sterol desaturase/sphingolipid hydroxylase (fatty acid hydroxylase superfamily)